LTAASAAEEARKFSERAGVREGKELTLIESIESKNLHPTFLDQPGVQFTLDLGGRDGSGASWTYFFASISFVPWSLTTKGIVISSSLAAMMMPLGMRR